MVLSFLHRIFLQNSLTHSRGPFIKNMKDFEHQKSFFDSKQLKIVYFSIVNTGKSLSEALIFASINPQYDYRLFMELPWKLQAQNMVCNSMHYSEFYFSPIDFDKSVICLLVSISWFPHKNGLIVFQTFVLYDIFFSKEKCRF